MLHGTHTNRMICASTRSSNTLSRRATTYNGMTTTSRWWGLMPQTPPELGWVEIAWPLEDYKETQKEFCEV